MLGYPTITHAMLALANELFPELAPEQRQRAWMRTLMISQLGGRLGEIKRLFRKAFCAEHSLYRRALARFSDFDVRTQEGRDNTLAISAFIGAASLPSFQCDLIRKQLCEAVLFKHAGTT